MENTGFGGWEFDGLYMIEADALTSATVMGTVKNGGEAAYSYWQMFIGQMPGALGETSTLLLFVGFGYMCFMGIVNAEASLTYIGTVLVLTFVCGPEGLFTGDILMNLFGGGLMLGGCYMLSDYAFASRKGKLLYAVTAGVITAGCRIFSNYPEGVCFGSYMVTVKQKGYGGDIVMNVSFDESASTVTGVEVVEQSETENVGARIAEAEFLDQFKGVAAPVYLPGMTVGSSDTADEAADADEEPAALRDGEYVAKTTEADENGFIDQVTMTVKDGKITEANWEALLEDGTKKSDMSENGQYTMTEDGPTWAEESKALTDGLVASQSLDYLTIDDTGHTDAVASVSIYVGGFAALAEDCLKQAAGTDAEEPAEEPAEEAALQEGTQVDGVSGATISSTAAVKAINRAFDFLQTVK